MARRMSVDIDVLRLVTETWSFDLEDDEVIEDVFIAIKNNPDIIWTAYDSVLDMADDVDERVEAVTSYIVEN
jgi:hypothetical protein